MELAFYDDRRSTIRELNGEERHLDEPETNNAGDQVDGEKD
jgi:hypothetical protein